MMMVMVVMMGSSVAIFGLLLKVWVVAGLCGGGARGRAWAKQGVRSCLSSLECFVGSHLDRSQKNSDLSHQIFLAHITLPASLLSGLIALGAGVMRMMRMMRMVVIKDWDWGEGFGAGGGLESGSCPWLRLSPHRPSTGQTLMFWWVWQKFIIFCFVSHF